MSGALPNKNYPSAVVELTGNSVTRYGASETIGGRRSMEDASRVDLNFVDKGFYGGRASIFLICDGHGIANGERASHFARENLPEVLRAKVQLGADPSAAMIEAFEETSRMMLTQPEMDDTGTTATLVYVEGNKVIVANVGDTEAVLLRDNSPVVLTKPHKAYLEEERIIAAGGEMRQGRVRGNGPGWNAVGRSLGEKNLGYPYVIPTPDIVVLDVEPTDAKIIIGCDGLWDEVNPEDAANLVRDISDPQQAAEKLVHEAADVRYSSDNVSAIVVNLKQL